MRRAPRFWFRPPGRPGALPRLLAPLALIWREATRRRLARPSGPPVGASVICVGNIAIGGTGKTPAVHMLAQRLQAAGRRPAIVSRGYGGRLAGPVAVDPARHGAAEVGDEALLSAAFAPTFVARDRAAGARAAVAAGADVVLLDDGFQNPVPPRDLQIVVVDAETGFGNRRVIPAGPLREPVEAGLARADALLLVGSAPARAAFAAAESLPPGLPVIGAEIRPLEMGMDWRGLRALAFAGIGRPEKFFAALAAAGAELVGTVPLGDHQRFSRPLLERLAAAARRAGARLVTTEKDAARLPAWFRPEVLVFPVRMHPATEGDAARLDALLARALGGVSP